MLILLTAPISVYSQAVYETVINKDTVVVIPKHHAKTLARERIMYRSLQEENKAKDSLIQGLNTHIEAYEAVATKQDRIILNYRQKDSILRELNSSYNKEIEKLSNKTFLQKAFPYFMGIFGFLLGILL